MNIVIIVMFLGSVGFIFLGTLLLNNKYVKSKNTEDKSLVNEVKAMKVTGWINITIGAIGFITALISLLNESLNRTMVIVFIISIAILSLTQYVLSKKFK